MSSIGTSLEILEQSKIKDKEVVDMCFVIKKKFQ